MSDGNKRLDKFFNTGTILGLLIMVVLLAGFWVLFIKPLDFASKTAVMGLDNVTQPQPPTQSPTPSPATSTEPAAP